MAAGRIGVVVIAASVFVWPLLTNAAAASDACALLTQAEASAALGAQVAAGKRLGPTSCHWDQIGKPGDELLKLDVTLLTVDRYNHMKAVTVGAVTNVPGVGDDAYFSTLKTTNMVITTLNIKKGNGAVTIRVSGGKKPAAEYQTKEKAAAQVLVPKL